MWRTEKDKNLAAFEKKKVEYEKQLAQVEAQLAKIAPAINTCAEGDSTESASSDTAGRIGKNSLTPKGIEKSTLSAVQVAINQLAEQKS